MTQEISDPEALTTDVERSMNLEYRGAYATNKEIEDELAQLYEKHPRAFTLGIIVLFLLIGLLLWSMEHQGIAL